MKEEEEEQEQEKRTTEREWEKKRKKKGKILTNSYSPLVNKETITILNREQIWRNIIIIL